MVSHREKFEIGNSELVHQRGRPEYGGNVLAQLVADGGDFNLWFASPGPQGVDVLTLDSAVGPMTMTEFSPVALTPEPGTSSLVLIGVGLLALVMRKRTSLGHQPAN